MSTKECEGPSTSEKPGPSQGKGVSHSLEALPRQEMQSCLVCGPGWVHWGSLGRQESHHLSLTVPLGLDEFSHLQWRAYKKRWLSEVSKSLDLVLHHMSPGPEFSREMPSRAFPASIVRSPRVEGETLSSWVSNPFSWRSSSVPSWKHQRMIPDAFH